MSYDYKELGSVLRRIRKSKGLRLEDIADDRISVATISSIERGVESVKSEKRAHYLHLLGVEESELPHYIDEERQNQSYLKNQFILIESRIDLGSLRKAKQDLKRLEQEYKGRSPEILEYLKAKYYYKRDNWVKAQKHFLQSIEMVRANPGHEKNNIEACCLKDLARISFFYENDINQSLEYVNQGLNAFRADGERSEIQYFLLIGKVIYLEKLNRTDEALQLIIEIWEWIDKITNLDVLLNMYETRATLLNKKGRCKDALYYATEGYKIAFSNQKYERSVELLTVWGDISTNMGDYETAEQCYQMALELEDKNELKFLIVTTCTQLGRLYQKMNKLEEARRYFEIAIKKGEKFKDVQRHCEALRALGDYFLEQNLYFDAILWYQKGDEIAKHHSLYNQRRYILVNLSECWKQLGREREFIETLNELQMQLRMKGGIGS